MISPGFIGCGFGSFEYKEDIEDKMERADYQIADGVWR